jgi:hypothetical protein
MLSNLRNCRQRLRFRNEAPVHHAQFCDPDDAVLVLKASVHGKL